MGMLTVFDTDNREAGTVDMDSGVFNAVQDLSLVHRAVVMQRACSRQGTAATRGRGEVSGSGKKPWKQKHTGRARAGSVRSPIWRHGGTVFGPRPRKYGYHVPKKVYRAALQSALSAKVSSGEVVVLSDVSLPELKTQRLAQMLMRLGLSGKTLMVVGGEYQELERPARNLKNLKLVRVNELNVYDLVWCEKLAIIRSQLSVIQEFWS